LEFLSFFIQEFEICAALVFGVLLLFWFFLLSPSIVVPSPVIIFFIVIVCIAFEWEIVFQSFFAIWMNC
jgi:hypothetical protein